MVKLIIFFLKKNSSWLKAQWWLKQNAENPIKFQIVAKLYLRNKETQQTKI